MERRRFLASISAGSFSCLAGCQRLAGSSAEETSSGPGESPGTETSAGSRTESPTTADVSPDGAAFRVAGDGFERWTDGGFEPLTVRGINLGMAKPGAFPGQAAITREEYDRWLAAMGDIANVVRTYTIHPPAFYRALAAYNETAAEPLFLLQGTWVPTAELLDADDATELSRTVDRELQRTVDVLHGEATLPERPGHASGTYDADVSGTTLGLLFGIEWPPDVVARTDERGTAGELDGRYLRAAHASPFERWLGGRLNAAVGHETETYGVQRPTAFVNWVTTDPLAHPYEPYGDEDSVSVDPDALTATDAYPAGTFAAYHAYPYYPDLLNETPSYVDYVDHRGEQNSYAGYLNDLVGSTSHPVLLAEFGVPSSRGIAHHHVHGRDQGRHTETRQGELVGAMYEDILHAGCAGGIVFSWQDEWFKRTWNLDERSVPGRRPFWSNIETPEQRFGLLAFEPTDGVSLDGSVDGWTDGLRVAATGDGGSGTRKLQRARVTHDYEGLAVRLEFEATGEPIDWSATNALVTIGLTGRRAALPFGLDATAPADFVVNLAGAGESRLLVESSYDAFAREFGSLAGLDVASYRTGDAGFVPVYEPVTLGYTVPPTGEQVPFDAVETGQLRYGVGNPAADQYDSLTDVYAAPDGRVVEVRLPWVLLNVADPSSKRRIETDWDAGLEVTSFDEIDVGVATYAPNDDAGTPQSDSTAVDRAAPGARGDRLETVAYGWEEWNRLSYDERLKESYEVLRRTDWAGDPG